MSGLGLRWLGVVFITMILAACGASRDGAPSHVPKDISSIPDAVPKDEPLSKYGNPRQYEVLGKNYYTLASAEDYHEKGIASWYGTKFHGRRTSSGEIYDMYAMTAAHKTLPLPTYVEVTNLKNGRKVVVKVNDRGPFHADRLIDLSYAAAKKLGIVATGTGLVEIRTVTPASAKRDSATQVASRSQPVAWTKPVKSASSAQIFLQVGAFSSRYLAEQVKIRLQQNVSSSGINIMPYTAANNTLYRVRVGPLSSVEQGDNLAGQLVGLGFYDSHIIVE